MRDEFYFPSKDGNTEIHRMETGGRGKSGIADLPRNGGVYQAI